MPANEIGSSGRGPRGSGGSMNAQLCASRAFGHFESKHGCSSPILPRRQHTASPWPGSDRRYGVPHPSDIGNWIGLLIVLMRNNSVPGVSG